MKKIMIIMVLTLIIKSLTLTVFSTQSVAASPLKNKEKIGSIMLYGNSITHHAPSAQVGWDGDWGMAATCRDSDYVHRIQKEIFKISRKVEIQSRNIAAFENKWKTFNLSELDSNLKADMVVMKISENIRYKEGMDSLFLERYDQLIKKVSKPNSVVIIVGGFWTNPVNDLLKYYAEKNNLPFVPLSDLYENDKRNTAIGKFKNKFVGLHPSDYGMRNIAERIMKVLRKYEYK